MGIFADKCEALIDRDTGKALSGKALEEAQKDPKWPRCRYKVKKAARFCSKCGKSAPGGWWKCPGCGKWVGNDSHYCWNCKAALHPDSRDLTAGGVWERPGAVLAQRFEVGDVRRLLEKGIQVQSGTAALLLDGGKFKGALGPGRHNLESLARTINHWGSAPPRTAILVDDGDVALPLRIQDLRSAEEIPVEFYGEVAFHLNPKKAEPFLANLMKEKRELRCEDLTEILLPEVRHAVDTLCIASTIEDLVKDPERRLRLEDQLTEALRTALDRYGLELVRVASAEFTGKEYERLRQAAGDLELKRREIEFNQRVRELLSSDRMQEVKTEQELEDYVNQLAQEKEVSSERREHELARLRQVHRHEFESEEAVFQMQREAEQLRHDLELDSERHGQELRKLVQEAKARGEAARATTDAEVYETDQWLDVKQKKLALKREHEEEVARLQREDELARAEALEGKSFEALIAATSDPQKRAQLLELHSQLQQAGSSPEQILAMQAGTSPAAAQALQEALRRNREQMEQDYQERQRISDDAADRLERTMKEALASVSEAVKGKGAGGDVHIVR